ncbi:hypothetical protein [Ancylobacter terrae]|uniref:hypothetical protein n=1 Tax=Ancylobacter sp. sgz301288 TaxID=3342077 RepID=UPI00385F1A2B
MPGPRTCPTSANRTLLGAASLAALAGGAALALTLMSAPAAAQQPVPDPPKTVPAPVPVLPAAPAAKPAAPAPDPAAAGGTEPTLDAESPDMARVAACKTRALARLKEQSPSVDDIFIDVDGLTIAESTGKLGDIPVKGVIMGEAYIQRDHSDRANRFLCLTGEKDEVLFTFFTER